jgi:DnaJ-class molecular chaperone
VPEGEFESIPRAGDDVLRGERGPLKVTVAYAPHATFAVRSAETGDLVHVARVDLVDALLGFTYSLPLLDGKNHSLVRSGVTPSGTEETVHGHGLPVPASPTQRGDIFVVFDVAFPAHMSAAQREALATALRGPERRAASADGGDSGGAGRGPLETCPAQLSWFDAHLEP